MYSMGTCTYAPPQGLAPEVLKKALPDIIFFVAVFFITLLAFSQLFYVQLGPFMVDYTDQWSSFMSLGRALFGDFDVVHILANSQVLASTSTGTSTSPPAAAHHVLLSCSPSTLTPLLSLNLDSTPVPQP